MKALVVTALGDPTAPLDDSVLKLTTQHPVPKLPAGHVRIRTVAASLNFADMLQVQGSYQVGMPDTQDSCCDWGCTWLDARRVDIGREAATNCAGEATAAIHPGLGGIWRGLRVG